MYYAEIVQDGSFFDVDLDHFSGQKVAAGIQVLYSCTVSCAFGGNGFYRTVYPPRCSVKRCIYLTFVDSAYQRVCCTLDRDRDTGSDQQSYSHLGLYC